MMGNLATKAAPSTLVRARKVWRQNEISTYIQGMSNTLYIKFLMRKLIKYLETGKQKEAKKIIKKIMEELQI